MILRFLQRYATIIAVLAGVIIPKLVLPGDPAWWLRIAVGLPIALGVSSLLHKDGVSNRPRLRKGTPSR